MTFSSVPYLFFVCHAGTAIQTLCGVLIARLSARKPSEPLFGVVADDNQNNGTDIQMSIQLRQQRVTFVWRTRVPNCTLLILNLYLHNSVDE